MRIVFIGTVEFSLKALEKLIELDANIVGVCTKEKSFFCADYADLTKVCKENQILYKYVDDINSKESVEWIKKLNPDIIFFWMVIANKKELLELPKMGIVGYHPANLPKNRGRRPLIWALALGLKKSASTFFSMKEGADDGDILSQKEFEIKYEDDTKTLYKKVTNLALKQIEEFLPKLENRTYKVKKQDETLGCGGTLLKHKANGDENHWLIATEVKESEAFTKEESEIELDKLEEKWGKRYPIVFQSWKNKWDNLSVYFKYPADIRKVIYTTNIIESVHRQFRKLTKTKGAFPNDNSLLKLLFMGIRNAEKKWTMPIRNWSLTISQLAIHFEGRLDKALDL